MIRNNSKGSIKVINAKITNPLITARTPTSSASALVQRMMNIVSPPTNRKIMSSEQKIVSIDLKGDKDKDKDKDKKQTQSVEQNRVKKIVKVRRKTQSVDKVIANSCRKINSINPNSCFSQKRLQKTESTTSISNKFKCFEEVNSCDLGFEVPSSSRSKQTNWDQIVQSKKQQLYSQLYKMDKKIFALERDMDEMPTKKFMMEMVRKKTSISKQNSSGPDPILIHTNIYKMAKNRYLG